MSILIKDMEMPTSCANCELAMHFDGYNENECPFNAFSYYDCPLSEIEPAKHGTWIWKDHYLVCSECGEENDRTNYCPNCGARMDGKVNV